MARAEVGTPKWLSNKMKAKGLQRLKWYCQMCEKQCRDENGFKCHILSETHARQMQVFSQRPGKFMDEFSRSFEADFMRFMRTRYCRTRVLANTVYCELISNKTHIHMNATVWTTLSEFVRYLGTTGKCKIEKTARGWYLTYIDQEKLARERTANEQQKSLVTAEQLEDRRIRRAVKNAAAEAASSTSEREDPIDSFDKSHKVELKLPPKGSAGTSQSQQSPLSSKRSLASLFDCEKESNVKVTIETKSRRTDEGDFAVHPLEDSDLWLSLNILVRISKPDWEFTGQKGIVRHVMKQNDRALCILEVLPDKSMSRKKLRVDQHYVESIIPKPGKWVRVVLGVYRGFEGRVLQVDEQSEEVSVSLFTGPYWGDVPSDDLPTAFIASETCLLYANEVKGKVICTVALERGEFVINQMPFDSVCRVAPPPQYEDSDQAFELGVDCGVSASGEITSPPSDGE